MKHLEIICRIYIISSFIAGIILDRNELYSAYWERNGVTFLIPFLVSLYMFVALFGHHILQIIAKIRFGVNLKYRFITSHGIGVTIFAALYFVLNAGYRLATGNFGYDINELYNFLTIIVLVYLSYYDHTERKQWERNSDLKTTHDT
jgi:hypothetical protein